MAFGNIYGHENQIAILQRAMAKNRVAHAYLFYGMEGIGKKTTSLAFAKAINCLRGENFDACDRCSSCLKANHKNHPDIVKLEAEGQIIRIQDIRDIQNQMQFRPFEGMNRIIIIADADKMNIASANALLKTLEEPSAGNILILVTSRFYLLPVTIISRCQHLRFNPLKNDIVASYLRDQSALDPDSASRLAAASGGSIGRALEMNKNDYVQDRDDIFNMLLEANKTNLLNMLFYIVDLGQQPKSIIDKLSLIKTCYRDVLVFRETGEQNCLINNDRLSAIKTLGESLSGLDILNNIKVVEEALGAIEQNANKQLTLEAMMFRLAIK